MKKLRYVLLCPEYFDGRLNGIGRVSGLVAEVLAEFGFEVEVWSANEMSSGGDTLGRCFGRNYVRMMWSACAISLQGVAGVVSMHAGLSPVARLLSARLGKRFPVFFYGIDVWKKMPMRANWGLRGASRIVSISEFTLREFHRFNPSLATVASTLLPLGLMNGEGGEIAVEAEKDNRAKILCVSRLTKYCHFKNIRTLIDAMPQVLEALPEASLTIVGDGDDRNDLIAHASLLACRDRIHFAGRVGDDALGGIYRDHDIFVMPSEQEGFGLVYAEAMVHGLPCVCGDADASREVVEDGVTGLSVPARSPSAVAGAIIRILGDEALRKRMGAAGRERVQKHFSYLAVRERIRELFRSEL